MTESSSEEKEHIVFEVKNYIDDIKAAIAAEVPLSEEASNTLSEFNEFDLDKLVARKGKVGILKEITQLELVLENQQVTNAVSNGIALAQQIYPSQPIKPIPIYLLYAGGSTDAVAMRGGFALNFGNLMHHEANIAKLLELVTSLSAHETVHQFLEQLGVTPKEEPKTYEETVLYAMWEEGLTTTVQTVHYPWHEILSKDYIFYAEIMNEWLKVGDDMQQKQALFDKCFGRESFQRFMALNGSQYRENLMSEPDLDRRFMMLMTYNNGPAYHLGFMLWKEQLQNRTPMETLVKGGHKQISEWLERSVGKVKD